MWCFDACAGSWFLLLVLIRWTGSSGTFPPMLCVLLLWNFQLAHNWRMSLYNGFRGCKHECCLAHIHPFTWLFSCYNAVKGNWTWLSSLQHMSKIGGFRRVSISSLLHLVPSWSEVHCWRKPISQLKPRQHILLHTLVQHSCCCSSSLSWAHLHHGMHLETLISLWRTSSLSLPNLLGAELGVCSQGMIEVRLQTPNTLCTTLYPFNNTDIRRRRWLTEWTYLLQVCSVLVQDVYTMLTFK